MTAAVLDHLWQSSLFAAACAALTLALRANHAGVRFWLWFAASLKFLLPFAGLAAAGRSLSGLFPLPAPARLLAIRPAAERLADPVHVLASSHPQTIAWAPWLAALWLAGMAAVLLARLLRGLTLKAALAQAHDLPLAAPVPVKATRMPLEPGLDGIFRPVILFPAGLLERLSAAEVDAILAHETAHLARRDNLMAAIHMLVEALFWFHPLVWLIGARMVAERERACDETVLAHGHAAEVYAGSIVGVCRFCVASPLPCAAGAGGADLNARVSQIMLGQPGRDLDQARRLLLAVCALASVALPVAAGFVSLPLVVAMKSRVVAAQAQVAQAIGAAAAPDRIGPVAMAHAVLRIPRPKPVAAPAPGLAAVPDAPQPSAVPSTPAAVPSAVVVIMTASAPRPVARALDPRGEGDPDAVTCRLPQTLPGSRLPGPEVCKVNRLWAELREARATISPDGREVDLPSDGERHRNLRAVGCESTGGAAAGSFAGLPMAFCF